MGDVTHLPAAGEIFEDLIPQELKAIPRWVVWRLQQRKDDSTRLTKTPYVATSGKHAKVNDPATWSTYDEAILAHKAHRYSGVGFVITNEDDIYIYDLDKCLNPKNFHLEAWAEEIMQELQSYTEITPSGTGIRVIVRGEIGSGVNKKKNLSSYDGGNLGEIECYKEVRYVTVTGNHHPEYPKEIVDVGQKGSNLWDKIFKKRSKEEKRVLKDDRIKKLFEGDLSDYAEDHSKADMALCRYLAELYDGDPARVDETFRKSKLFRAKWDAVHVRGETYGAATIAKAIEGFKKLYRLTDTGDAKRFAQLTGDELRNCDGKWFIWDGMRLCEDKTRRIYLYMDRLVKATLEDSKGCETAEKKEMLGKHAHALESKAKTEAVIALAASRAPLPVLSEELDRNHRAINVRNGIVEEGILREHAFEEMMTKLANVTFDKKAKCPNWLKFLKDTLVEEDVISYLSRAIGYSMTGLTTEHAIFFVYGFGANGKSTFLNVLLWILGEYAKNIPTEMLMDGREQHPTGLSDLRGVRLALATEIQEGKRWNESLIKSLTGGERIVARRMHGNFFEFDSTAKLWVMGNHKPSLRGADNGIRRRFHFIPFTRTVPKELQDPFLKEKLFEEASGIFNWMIEGYLSWKKQGLNPPPSIVDATNEYFDEMDIIGNFVREECEEGSSLNAPHAALFERYLIRAKEKNERPMSSIVFGRKMSEKRYEHGRGAGGAKVWKGLSLRKDVQGELDDGYNHL